MSNLTYVQTRDLMPLDPASWADVDALLATAPGTYSACVCRLDGRLHYSYGAEVVHPAASLIKVAIALTVDHYATDLNILDLSGMVELTADVQVAGDGTVDHAPVGSRWSYHQLIAHMLHESDNTAGNLLIDLLDRHTPPAMDAVNHLSMTLDATRTRLQRRFMDLAAARAGRENLTCALDMCRLFVSMQSHPLLQHLRDSAGLTKLVAGLPPGMPVAHKGGDLPQVEHDVGIVYALHAPYVVALLSSNLRDVHVGGHILATASRLIYQHMTENTTDGT